MGGSSIWTEGLRELAELQREYDAATIILTPANRVVMHRRAGLGSIPSAQAEVTGVVGRRRRGTASRVETADATAF
jgi:hypothetical protein